MFDLVDCDLLSYAASYLVAWRLALLNNYNIYTFVKNFLFLQPTIVRYFMQTQCYHIFTYSIYDEGSRLLIQTDRIIS